MKLILIATIFLLLPSGCQTLAANDIPSLIQKSTPSVVRVYSIGIDEDDKQIPIVVGTGFIVAPGKVATAAHVVMELPRNLIFLVPADLQPIKKNNELKEYSADVVLSEPKHDLALLQCHALISRPPLRLHNAEGIKMGEDAIVLGFPLGDPTLTATRAMIAAIKKEQLIKDDPKSLTNGFKLDASINKGNSGGPIIHIPSGKVIGMVSAKYGALSERLKIFQKKKPKTRIVIGGDDPVEILKETLIDMEKKFNLGLGFGISIEYLKALLEKSSSSTVE